MSDLIDTTEMYLRTVYELEEEGIVPLRARIAERLQQSGPTVSQTVARMERDGLLSVEGDRHLELSPTGRQLATRVMRKHRLAERLLTDVIGLDIAHVHEEACRWEHVMSDQVEHRLVSLLSQPSESPYGNPIPGLSELEDGATAPSGFLDGVQTMTEAIETGTIEGQDDPVRLEVRRLSEEIQKDTEVMAVLSRVGVLPGYEVSVSAGKTGLVITRYSQTAEIDHDMATYIFVAIRED